MHDGLLIDFDLDFYWINFLNNRLDKCGFHRYDKMFYSTKDLFTTFVGYTLSENTVYVTV